MAASRLALNPLNEIHLFEKRAGLGRKLLIAGSSGLNISHEATLDEFVSHYDGFTPGYWKQLFQNFGKDQWVQFIENELGLPTFLGTSDRYFVKEMKASGLLKRWISWLEERGVKVHPGSELVDFESAQQGVRLSFAGEAESRFFNRAYFFLGGGSWEDQTPAWVSLFKKKGIGFRDFEPSNVGYEIDWKPEFLKEAEGKPFKKITLETKRGEKAGELVVTKYGIEGTPVYFRGCPGVAFLDLKPDLTLAQIMDRLNDVKENLAPIRRVKQKLGLPEASLALLFHHTPVEIKNDLKKLSERIKKFPITLKEPRPLSESISSKGGVLLAELNESLELKKFPSVFCGGEMLDWDAPTGGFLIQACVSQGASVAK